MAETKLQIDHRLDRIEKAITLMSEKTMYAEDQEEFEKILRGEKLKEPENDGEQSSEHHPDYERQDKSGSEVSGGSDSED